MPGHGGLQSAFDAIHPSPIFRYQVYCCRSDAWIRCPTLQSMYVPRSREFSPVAFRCARTFEILLRVLACDSSSRWRVLNYLVLILIPHMSCLMTYYCTFDCWNYLRAVVDLFALWTTQTISVQSVSVLPFWFKDVLWGSLFWRTKSAAESARRVYKKIDASRRGTKESANILLAMQIKGA